MAALNSNAQEFYPNNQLHKLQCHFPTPIISVPHHHYLFPQPNPFYYYYPTVTTTLPFSPAHVETQEQQQQEKKVITREKTNGFQRVVRKEVFKILSCEKTVSRGPRFSDGGLRFQPFDWRKKEAKDVIREKKYYDRPCVKNRQNVVRERKNFRASSIFQKRAFPVVPVRPDGDETTVMIKNIPSKYTREMLVEFLENHCMYVNGRDRESGEENILAFDFVYLPMDFGTGMNKGYAFVNFTEPKAAWKFLMTASQRKWELFYSHKIREVVLARIQGKENLESHFKTMNFPYELEDVLPLSFNPPRDGVIKGDQKTLGRLLKATQHL